MIVPCSSMTSVCQTSIPFLGCPGLTAEVMQCLHQGKAVNPALKPKVELIDPSLDCQPSPLGHPLATDHSANYYDVTALIGLLC